jgi:hypothetical protein
MDTLLPHIEKPRCYLLQTELPQMGGGKISQKMLVDEEKLLSPSQEKLS